MQEALAPVEFSGLCFLLCSKRALHTYDDFIFQSVFRMFRKRRGTMKDMQAQLEKLRVEAANCQMISGLATDKEKRELFARLAEHYKVLAEEVERAIKQRKRTNPTP